jgi:hypothetical protein
VVVDVLWKGRCRDALEEMYCYSTGQEISISRWNLNITSYGHKFSSRYKQRENRKTGRKNEEEVEEKGNLSLIGHFQCCFFTRHCLVTAFNNKYSYTSVFTTLPAGSN